MYYAPPVPPQCVAFDATSYAMRAQFTYARRLYMEGGWPVQLSAVMTVLLTDQAANAMPVHDTSHNIFRDTIIRLSTRYENAPTVKDGEVGELDTTVLFADHPTIEQYALAYNVAVLSLRVIDGDLVADVLPPDHADILFDHAGRMLKVRVARPYNVCGSSAQYFVEEWDIAAKKYSVLGAKGWEVQAEYPWVYEDGRAFAPVVFFRASKQPDWWGADRWPELIEATLEEGLAWTIHRYGRLNSSTGLPYTMDAEAVGRTVSQGQDGGENHVQTGPNYVLGLKSMNGKQGSVGVLQPTFDPEKDVEAIVAAYNSRMACLGIGDAALQRGGAESGYAIVVRREGLLRLRNLTEPMFRQADQEFLRKAVSCTRLFMKGPAESDKYRIEYAPVSMGSAENKEMRDQEKHDLDIGVASPASIVARREGIALEEAQRQLALLKELESGTAPTPTAPTPQVEGQVPPAPENLQESAPQG